MYTYGARRKQVAPVICQLLFVLGPAAAVLFCASPAYAGPVLIASHDAFTNGGGAPEADPRIQFVLELPFSPTSPRPSGVGQGVFFEDNELRIVYFDASNDPAFATFADTATDGREDSFSLYTLFPSGGGTGHHGLESELFGVGPDLAGHTLDYIKLIVFDVRLDPWVPDPDQFPEIQGYTFEAFLRYEFYGTPIPEPTTVVLAACGVAWCLRWRGPGSGPKRAA